MFPRLKQIEIENFKSYKDRCVIGPLKSFNAVIGPNGSGKSNFMDAISFVMGEKKQSLRVRRLSDLIHGAVINRAVSKTASVTAIITLGDNPEHEMAFERSIQGSSSEYKIDGNIVTANDYLSELEKLKINVKAKNFLVFQGAVELIVMKNPKEMTAFFEEISGSGAHNEEYDELKQQMLKTEEEINFAVQKKKGINAERKEAEMDKKEADKYLRLKDDLNDMLVEHQLYRTFHNEKAMKSREQELKSKQKELAKIEKKKEKMEDNLKEKKKEHGKCNRELAKIEQDIREAEAEVSKKKPMFIKAKEKVSHFEKKVQNAFKTLDQAKNTHKDHIYNIRKLEQELTAAEKSKDEYEQQIANESQSQGRDIHLEDAQVKEYHKLKEEAAKRSARYMQELDSVNREQRSEQDRLDNVSRLRTDAENKRLQKCREKEEIEKRIEKLTEHIRTSEQALNDQQKMLLDLQLEVGSSRNKVQEVQKHLEDVLDQLGDARTDKHEDARKKKKQEILYQFKENYSGVFDRMINLCQPSHKRYNVAITKVFGRYMEAIVVDTVHTAQMCIKYLKEQKVDTETFLPLTYLQTKPVKETLRRITDPKNVMLIYDVLKFDPVIENAVKFVTNNALVCETLEDANKVAFELGGRYNAVALDGTYYQKSGLISGGSVDLARKAKRWDERDVSKLKAQKEALTNELREAMKITRKESEMNTVASQIRSSETRLHYARGDLATIKTQLKAVDAEILVLVEELKRYGPEIEAIEKGMHIRESQIGKIKLRMNTVEDDVFSDFCSKIGLKTIRQYEDRELRAQDERIQKRLEFQMQINRITNNLEFERSRDTQSNVSRWERTVNDEKEQLEIAKKQMAKQKEGIDNEMKNLDEHKAKQIPKKKEIEKMEEELRKARKELGAVTKDAQDIQKSTLSMETKIEGLKHNRRAILLQCKMDGIVIPLLVGNMEDIVATDPSNSSSNETSTAQYEREARIQIDYSNLSDDLKDLEDRDAIKKAEKNLYKALHSLQDTLQKIQAPNMKALEKLELVQGKLQSNNKDFENLKKQNKKAKAAFEEIKHLRYEKFTACFDHVAKKIDTIYKLLAHNPGAQAFLGTENPEEPYLGGINYNCVAPGKVFQPISNLSGGEKTVASLALLFAIHAYRPAPFFVLDEIDASLDNTNIGKVAKFICEKKESLQIIVISLKKEFYSHTDNLIGIHPRPGDCLISQVLTMDLTGYEVPV